MPSSGDNIISFDKIRMIAQLENFEKRVSELEKLLKRELLENEKLKQQIKLLMPSSLSVGDLVTTHKTFNETETGIGVISEIRHGDSHLVSWCDGAKKWYHESELNKEEASWWVKALISLRDEKK